MTLPFLVSGSLFFSLELRVFHPILATEREEEEEEKEEKEEGGEEEKE